jgi:hypothetical protein
MLFGFNRIMQFRVIKKYKENAYYSENVLTNYSFCHFVNNRDCGTHFEFANGLSNSVFHGHVTISTNFRHNSHKIKI